MSITVERRLLAFGAVVALAAALTFSVGIASASADTGDTNSPPTWHPGDTNSGPHSTGCWDDNAMKAKWDDAWNKYSNERHDNEDWWSFFDRMGWKDLKDWHDRQTNCDDNWNWKSEHDSNWNNSTNDNWNKDQPCDTDWSKNNDWDNRDKRGDSDQWNKDCNDGNSQDKDKNDQKWDDRGGGWDDCD